MVTNLTNHIVGSSVELACTKSPETSKWNKYLCGCLWIFKNATFSRCHGVMEQACGENYVFCSIGSDHSSWLSGKSAETLPAIIAMIPSPDEGFNEARCQDVTLDQEYCSSPFPKQRISSHIYTIYTFTCIYSIYMMQAFPAFLLWARKGLLVMCSWVCLCLVMLQGAEPEQWLSLWNSFHEAQML